MTQTIFLIFQSQNEKILSNYYFNFCDFDSCKFVQLLVDCNCDYDSRERIFDLNFKFRFDHECFTFCEHYEYWWLNQLHDDFDHERIRKLIFFFQYLRFRLDKKFVIDRFFLTTRLLNTLFQLNEQKEYMLSSTSIIEVIKSKIILQIHLILTSIMLMIISCSSYIFLRVQQSLIAILIYSNN